ncbi:MAG: HigA family addiction module antidote protein [Bacteroidales bacterium]|nr:HigA family addiction module antidote protein [Bacteroidales bacterium]
MSNLGYGFHPTHPGEIIKDEIEYRNIKPESLALNLGMSKESFEEILSAHKPLTAEIALMLEAVLDVPADSLMQLQTKYNMQIAKQDKTFAAKLNELRKKVAVF